MFKQTLNWDNSASRRAREGSKKGKSSEFNPRNNEQVKSSPTIKVWSHGGSNLYPKMVKNDSIGLKQGHRMGLKMVFRGRVKVFLGSKGHN